MILKKSIVQPMLRKISSKGQSVNQHQLSTRERERERQGFLFFACVTGDPSLPLDAPLSPDDGMTDLFPLSDSQSAASRHKL